MSVTVVELPNHTEQWQMLMKTISTFSVMTVTQIKRWTHE